MTAVQTGDVSRRVLVVDDFPVIRRIIAAQLDALGITDVDTAEDGREAMRLLLARPYDLVISDWNMEPVSGADLIRAARANAALDRTRFMVVTAESRTEVLLAARAAGADMHLLKPFKVGALRTKLEQAWAA